MNSIRSLSHARKRVATFAVALAMSMGVLSGTALAHAVNWWIPYLGFRGWGYACHEQREWPWLDPDYKFCAGADVYQSSPGSFVWYGAHVTNGVEYNPVAIYENLYLFDQNGVQLRVSDAFFCDRVSYSQYVFFYTLNPTSTGYYQQQSGGGANQEWCYSSYVRDDYLTVIGY